MEQMKLDYRPVRSRFHGNHVSTMQLLHVGPIKHLETQAFISYHDQLGQAGAVGPEQINALGPKEHQELC